jgi:hypothetical protein
MLKLPKYYGLWFIERSSSCEIFKNVVIFSKQMCFERVMIYPQAWDKKWPRCGNTTLWECEENDDFDGKLIKSHTKCFIYKFSLCI